MLCTTRTTLLLYTAKLTFMNVGTQICWVFFFFPFAAASMTALVVTACIIWCVCAAKSNRQKDGFHRLRQHRDEYDDEVNLTSMGSKKSLLSHEFQDESESDEETLYANKIWQHIVILDTSYVDLFQIKPLGKRTLSMVDIWEWKRCLSTHFSTVWTEEQAFVGVLPQSDQIRMREVIVDERKMFRCPLLLLIFGFQTKSAYLAKANK